MFLRAAWYACDEISTLMDPDARSTTRVCGNVREIARQHPGETDQKIDACFFPQADRVQPSDSPGRQEGDHAAWNQLVTGPALRA